MKYLINRGYDNSKPKILNTNVGFDWLTSTVRHIKTNRFPNDGRIIKIGVQIFFIEWKKHPNIKMKHQIKIILII